MSECPNADIKIYIDDIEQKAIVRRYKRDDVLNAIKGYGDRTTNILPGYISSVDISKLKIGEHTLKIETTTKAGKALKSQIVKFSKKYDTMFCVDSPSNSKEIENSVYIQGWLMSEDKGATVEVYINGNKINDNVIRTKRDDVLSAVSGYGGKSTNSEPGYYITVDTENIQDGKNELEVRIVSKTGDILESAKRTIINGVYESGVYIDLPYTNKQESDVLPIQGWLMSRDSNATVKIYIDGQEMQADIGRTRRQDVLDAINKYGGKETNSNAGYNTIVDISNLKTGVHTLEVRAVSHKGTEQSKVSKNFVKKYETKIELDLPQKVKTSVDVQGWVMSEDNGANVEIYLDDKKVETKIERTIRQDILDEIDGYGGKDTNVTPGYNAIVDTSNLKDGNHKITVKVISKTNEVIGQVSKNMNVRKYDGILNIDSPTSTQIANSKLEVYGWEMSEIADSRIELYVNNQNYTSAISRSERPDVISAITEYGGEDVNATPGFYAQIDTSSFEPGNYNVTLKLITKYGDVIATGTRKVLVYHNQFRGIDVSYANGEIDWEKVKASGIEFAIIRCGYGKDDVSQDDKYFSRNISECERLGIPYGIYLYSYALDVNGAVSEANHVLRLVKGHSPKYGIFIDMEDADGYKAKNGMPSNQTLVDICDTFCNIIKSNGYRTGVYASLYWWNNQLNDAKLNNYDRWVSQWNTHCDYVGEFVMWQYTSNGSVSGINGRVDMNICYKKY